MASIQRTDTVGDSCTRQTLYDLLSTANIVSIAESDLVIPPSAAAVTAASEAPASLSNGLWWYDQTEQLLKLPVLTVGGSAASFYMSVGPDRWDYPGFNICDEPMKPGDLVRWSYSPGAGIYDITFMEPCPTWYTLSTFLRSVPQLFSCYGVIAATIPAQQFGPVANMGFLHARVDWNSVYERDSTLHMKWSWPLFVSTQYTAMLGCIDSYAAATQNALFCGQTLNSPGTDMTTCTLLGAAMCRFPLGYRPARAT